jgi:hypothetical protein
MKIIYVMLFIFGMACSFSEEIQKEEEGTWDSGSRSQNLFREQKLMEQDETTKNQMPRPRQILNQSQPF